MTKIHCNKLSIYSFFVVILLFILCRHRCCQVVQSFQQCPLRTRPAEGCRISSFFTGHFCSRLRHSYDLEWLNCHKMRRGLSSKRKDNASSCFNFKAIFAVLFPCASRIFKCIGIFLLSCLKSRPNEPLFLNADSTGTPFASRSHESFVFFLCLMCYAPQWS